MRICSIEQCDGRHVARGLCRSHYNHARRLGNFKDIRPKNRQGCIFVHCQRYHYAKGFCRTHYGQWLSKGEVGPIKKKGANLVCEVPDCSGSHVADKLCRYHYDLRARTGYDLREEPELLDIIAKLKKYGLGIKKLVES